MNKLTIKSGIISAVSYMGWHNGHERWAISIELDDIIEDGEYAGMRKVHSIYCAQDSQEWQEILQITEATNSTELYGKNIALIMLGFEVKGFAEPIMELSLVRQPLTLKICNEAHTIITKVMGKHKKYTGSSKKWKYNF